MVKRVGPRGYTRKTAVKSQPRWRREPANKPTKPKVPKLDVVEGGKSIEPQQPPKSNPPGFKFGDLAFSALKGLGRNVFTLALEPSAVADGTLPESMRPRQVQSTLDPKLVTFGNTYIILYSDRDLPDLMPPNRVELPPMKPSYVGRLPIIVPNVPVIEEMEEREFMTEMSPLPDPATAMKNYSRISSDDVHVGDPMTAVRERIFDYQSMWSDDRWIGQADVIVTSTDYKPYDQEAAIREYLDQYGEKTKIISDIDLVTKTKIMPDGKPADVVEKINYSVVKADKAAQSVGRIELDKFSELALEINDLAKLNVSAQTRFRAGSREYHRHDKKSRYGEFYLAFKKVYDRTVGGEVGDLYFSFTNNLVSKALGRKRPPLREGYISFWDRNVGQWRYKPKTPWAAYEGWNNGFLNMNWYGFIDSVIYNHIEDAVIGKVSKMGLRGWKQQQSYFGTQGREIGYQVGPTL